VYLRMLRCGNIVRFLDVTKLTTLTPLSLLISCNLTFAIVGLKMSSLTELLNGGYQFYPLSRYEDSE
jgi:hypothetical protein